MALVERCREIIGCLPLSSVSYAFAYGSGALPQKSAARVYYNTHVKVNDRRIKYGVIAEEDLMADLLDWKWLYIAGRLQKPVVDIVAAPARVSGAVKENRVSALQAALLMLPDSFSQEELFEEIVALSYRGDFRMIIGEDKAKVKKIVIGSAEKMEEIYSPLLAEDSRIHVQSNRIIQDPSTAAIYHRLNLLPYSVISKLQRRWNRRMSRMNDAEEPFVPENGHVIFAEAGPYPPGTLARYSCALGFERVGAEERRCGSDGKWRGRPPLCVVDVAKGRPTEQSSGTAIQGEECALTEREARAWWSVELSGSHAVRALRIRLGEHSSQVENIELIQSAGDVVSCELTGINLFGNSSATVECEASDVIRVRVVARARLHLCSLAVYASNAVSSWQCGSPATVETLGVMDGMCFSTSREDKVDWSGAARACLERGGSLPMRLPSETWNALHAAIESRQNMPSFYWIGVLSGENEWRWLDGAPVGPAEVDFAEATQPGQGEAVILSRASGWKWMPAMQNTWNAYICQTKPKFCTSPGVGEAGRVTFSSNSYAIGTICFYECDEGYELVGSNQRVCGASGRWSGSIPACQQVDCGSPPLFDGETILLNGSTLFGSQVEFECARGFRAVGPTRRACTSDGRWDAPPPTCREVDCGRAPPIANGVATHSRTSLNASAMYACSEGYRLIGHDTIFCSEKGTWEPVSPVCYDVSALREMHAGAGETNALMAVMGVSILILLVIAFIRFSRVNANDSDDKITSNSSPNNNVIYASANPQDSVVYYATSAPLAQLEVPPQLLQLQQLPNGNIHVTLPIGRPSHRPPLPLFHPMPSPTPSQLLYSFEHEPIYDIPPDEPPDPTQGSDFEEVYGNMAPESDSTVC